MNKRDFLRQAGQAAIAVPLTWKAWAESPEPRLGPGAGPVDFWDRIRFDYDLNPDYINLESGYYNIIPRPTLETYIEKIKEVNYQGAYYMRTVQWDNKKRIAARLASFVGCPADELILTRNTTESLDMIISGFPWEEGDEAVYARQDYGAMRMQFQKVARNQGVVNKEISLPLHPTSDDEIVSLYESVIGPRTRLLMICHMVNITGQILPVRKICDMAHRHGVEVLVDGAHCIGHIEVDISELDCDYYGSSLHKWLAAPLGAGMLYIKKRHIHKISPLLAEHPREADDIERLNHTGTHPVHTDLAIDAALDYLENIGIQRKEKRLRFLQRYWTTPLRGNSGVLINTPEEPDRSCAIANVGVKNLKPALLAQRLQEDFGIYTVAIDGAGVHGCRITPNVFTSIAELDRLVEAVETLAS